MSVATAIRDSKHKQYHQANDPTNKDIGNNNQEQQQVYTEFEQWWTDREYGGRDSYRGRGQRFRGRKGYGQCYSYGHVPYQGQDLDRLNSC